jgi:lambda repressor-like predicted transcriptional regulator
MKQFSAEILLNEYGRDDNAASLAEIFGVSRTTICRWRNVPDRSWLSAYQADKYACRIGVHPANIWQNWYSEAVTK